MKAKLNLKLIAIFILIFLDLSMFQNCGKVSLRSQSSQVNIKSEESVPTYLKVPALDEQSLRLVVFVDMSNSMVKSPCIDDVDGPVAVKSPADFNLIDTNTAPCDPFAFPADPSMDRLTSVRTWLLDLKSKLPQSNLAKLKILIVPFTGGYVESARDSADSSRMVFYDNPDDAITWVNDLLAQQKRTLDFLAIAGKLRADQDPNAEDPMQMGTSVPKTRLGVLKQILSTEIDDLKTKSLLKSTDFQFVFLSDGNPIPVKRSVMEVFNRIWASKLTGLGVGQGVRDYAGCIQQCQTYVNYVLEPINEAKFTPGNIQSMNCTTSYTYVGEQPSNESFMGCSLECIQALGAGFDTRECGDPNELLSVVRGSWGNEQDNRPLVVVKAVDDIRKLMQQNSEANFHFHFYLIDQNKRSVDLDSLSEQEKTANWILYARRIFKKGSTHDQIMQANTKKDFFPQTISASSWKLKHFFAINVNSRVDRYGIPNSDSDGDGLFDDEESDPNKPDTPRSNNVCLDSIVKRYGCIMPGTDGKVCNPQLDVDGDSINECEEKTLGTDPYDFDTDNDGIPDSVEVLYGMNPLADDTTQDWSSDGVSNYDQFTMGLVPQVAANNVDGLYKTKVLLRFADYKNEKLGLNNVSVAGYTVKIDNLLLTNTKASNDVLILYKSPLQQEAQKIDVSLAGGTHNLLENKLILLGYVQSETNPSLGYWIVQEKIIGYGNDKVIDLDLSSFTEKFARDPKGSAN